MSQTADANISQQTDLTDLPNLPSTFTTLATEVGIHFSLTPIHTIFGCQPYGVNGEITVLFFCYRWCSAAE